MYTTNLKRVFISFLLGIMVFSSFSLSSPTPASAATGLSFPPGAVTAVTEAEEVTVSFSVYATPVSTLEALKASITVQRTDALAYSALDTNDTVVFSNTESSATLVVTFDNALTGNTNSIQIAANALMDVNGVAYSDTITFGNIDVAAPAYTGSVTYDNGAEVYLNFGEDFSINSGEEDSDTYLRSNMSVATDGVNFVPLLEQSDLYQNGNRQIYIRYYNDMQIILGTNTLIKIASGTIMDEAGNLNDEMIFQITPPVIQSVEISDDNQDVTVTYNVNVYDNTDGNLEDEIQLVKGRAWTSLSDGDTASVVDGKLSIHFAEALTGSNNQIYINGSSIKDSYGNVTGDDRITNIFGREGDSTDTTAPKLLNYYMTNSYQDFVLVFDEDVIAYDEETFKQNVQWYNNNWYYSLPTDSIITFSGHTVTIHFATPLITNQFYFYFYNNHFKDTSGNSIGSIGTNWLYRSSTMESYGGYFSHEGRWMSLEFSADLKDQTIVNGVSHLKEAITISLDHGSTFSALDPLDVVSIENRRLVVLFHDGKTVGSVQVKISAGVLSDLGDNIRNLAIDEVIAYNTPDITGYMFSNTASEFVFADYATWSSGVRDIYLYDDNIGTDRQLSSSEYTITAGKLTFINGLFQEGHYYYITVNADGYSSRYFEGRAHKTSEIFYVTAPTVTAENGITASINLFNNVAEDYYYYNDYLNATTGTQTVIFQLMNGSTPVSIVASKLRVSTGTYTANFNVIDADTNPNYTVRAFVVSKYNNDPASVGLNLATVKTQWELDQLIMLGNNNNNNYDD